jgi:dienelactone hydrolase
MRTGPATRLATLAAAVLAVAALATTSAVAGAALDPHAEAQNFAVTMERQAEYDTAAYQALMMRVGSVNAAHALAAQAADPQRQFAADLCWSGLHACAGDVRLYDWASHHYGIVRPVLFTARNGATISGHVWATVAGPARRPGIVITNGSVQADEQMYWYAAQALAKAGYVVLTFDPQGQGQSDTLGEGRDALEGVPAQTDGRPFYDGTEDAVNFFVSTPQHPYRPVPSCTTGTSHAAKQASRVRRGLDAADNPFWQLLDRSRLGLAGHSYGAAGVSYIAQWDPRIKAVVAWDNLGGPGPRAGAVPGRQGSIGEGGCPARPADRTTVPITKPGLGISADYGLPPTPNLSVPDPAAKDVASRAYTSAGVDTGEIVIRGGSHLDFSYIPLAAFGASLRGADLVDWYTTAWFDKYVKGDPTADRRLLTDRWRHDPAEARVDPTHDGNSFSFYYHSRIDIHLADGSRWDCEHPRSGCAGMASDDGEPAAYSYLAIATTPDARTGPGARIAAPGPNSIYASRLG